MRQAGILAAAGIVALERMVDRLSEDHENARLLADGISTIPGLATEPRRVQSNIVYIDLLDANFTDDEFIAQLQNQGVKLSHTGPARFRMVTHHGIGRDDIEAVIAVLSRVMRKTI